MSFNTTGYCLNIISISQIDRIIQYVYIYGNSVPIMLCNALTGVYFLVRGVQAVINIIIGKVANEYNCNQIIHSQYLAIAASSVSEQEGYIYMG